MHPLTAALARAAEAVHRAHNAQPGDFALAPPPEEPAPMTVPAEELRAAVQQLRPSSPAVAAHTVAVRIPVHAADALADWLEAEARQEAYTLAEFGHRGGASPHALTVARAVNGQQPRETGQEAAGEPHRASDGSMDADTAPSASQSRSAVPAEPCGQKAGVVVLPHPPHKFMRNARLYQCPGHDTPDAAPGDPATPTDADRLWTLETALRRVREAIAIDQPVTAASCSPTAPENAEDCPQCAGTNPPYPFICPGHDTPAEHACTSSCDGVPGIRGLLEHVGIDTTGRDITVAGKVIDAAPDGLRAQYAEALRDTVTLSGQTPTQEEQRVLNDLTAAVLAVRDREMQQLHRDAADMEQRVIDLGQQRRRAEQAEDLLRIAHDTSNKSEAERARAVQRAEQAEAERDGWRMAAEDRGAAIQRLSDALQQAETRLQHARDAAALHRKQLISTAELYATIEATSEPTPCPQQCGATHQCPLHTEPSSPAAKAKFTAEAPEQVGALQRQLHRADQARRAREHQLDDIRRALCDAGLMEDDDPYSHADLADVIRQTATEPYQQPSQCRYCPNPLCPEDCPECGGPIHDLDTPNQPPSPAATQATEPPAICDAYQPPTTAADSGLCARCGMFDYRHQEQP